MFKQWFLIGALFSSTTVASLVSEGFEGRIVYDIESGGQAWSYSVWMKGDLWRSELRSGQQVFELHMGNLDTRDGFW